MIIIIIMIDGRLAIQRDINEHMQVEDELRKEKALTESVLNSLQDILYVCDLNGRFLRWNKSLSAITGYSDKEISTKKPTDFVLGKDVQRICNAIEMVVKNGTSSIEVELVTKNGEHINYEFNGTLLNDYDGKPLGICGIGRNISERKRMDLEYKTILRSAMDGFYVTDSHGRILDVNDSYCSLTGYSRQELLNMSVKDIEATETEEMIAERIRQISKVGWERFETRHRCKDGRIVEIEASVNYNEAGGGKFFVFIRDFTEHKRIVEKVTESEERFHSITESANDAIITADSKGDIIFWNKCAQNLFGYRGEEIIGKQLTFLMPERYRDAHRKGMEQLFVTGVPHVIGKKVELLGLRKDGSEVIIDLSLSTWKTGDKVFYSGILRDITERKLAEEKIKQHEVHLMDMLALHRLGNNTENEVLDFTLEASLRSLQSEFAFVGMMSADEAVMTIHKWSKGAMNKCNVIDNPLVFPIAKTGLFGEAVRQRRPIIVNDYKTSPLFKKGYPEGHVPIKRFLCIPVFSDKKIVAIAAVANKVSEYTDSDVSSFTLFLNEMWGILDNQRTRKVIRKSLEEKEVLLREIHHRVKNNMQIVSSLLMLQSQNIIDKKYKDMFIESQTRVYSMALIHEKLYESENLAQINFKEYIDGIISNIIESYCIKSPIKIDSNIENVLIKIDNAVPIGIIINELITNSLKHAFPDGRQGKIIISLKSVDNNIQLSISDNGIGIPKELDILNTKSLGLHLVTSLAESQLKSKIILNRDNGTEFKLVLCKSDSR